MHPRLARFRLLTGPVLMATAVAMLLVPAGPASAKPPPGCASGGVKVMAGRKSDHRHRSTDTTHWHRHLRWSVTVSGTGFTIALRNRRPDRRVVVPEGPAPRRQNGTGTSGTSAVLNKKGAPQGIGYLVVYGVTSQAARRAARRASARYAQHRSREPSGAARSGPRLLDLHLRRRTAGHRALPSSSSRR